MAECKGGCGKDFDGMCPDCADGAAMLNENAIRLLKARVAELEKERDNASHMYGVILDSRAKAETDSDAAHRRAESAEARVAVLDGELSGLLAYVRQALESRGTEALKDALEQLGCAAADARAALAGGKAAPHD